MRVGDGEGGKERGQYLESMRECSVERSNIERLVIKEAIKKGVYEKECVTDRKERVRKSNKIKSGTVNIEELVILYKQ